MVLLLLLILYYYYLWPSAGTFLVCECRHVTKENNFAQFHRYFKEPKKENCVIRGTTQPPSPSLNLCIFLCFLPVHFTRYFCPGGTNCEGIPVLCLQYPVYQKQQKEVVIYSCICKENCLLWINKHVE